MQPPKVVLPPEIISKFDPDVFCYLFAHNGPGRAAAISAINAPQNRHRRVRTPSWVPLYYFHLLGVCSDDPCLALRFSDTPSTTLGVLLGSSPDADVVLLDDGCVGPFHVSFTFTDDDDQLVVRDMATSGGTSLLSYRGFESLSPCEDD